MSVNQKTEQLKWSELKGRSVIDIVTAKRMGSVEDFTLDLQTYQIVGLKFKMGLLHATQTVSVVAIKGIGEDAVTLQLEKENLPMESNKTTSKNRPTLSEIMGNGVVTESGKYVGAISNVLLNLQPLAITGYEVSKGGIFSKTHSFQMDSTVHYGEKLVIIPANLIDTFMPASEDEAEPT